MGKKFQVFYFAAISNAARLEIEKKLPQVWEMFGPLYFGPCWFVLLCILILELFDSFVFISFLASCYSFLSVKVVPAGTPYLEVEQVRALSLNWDTEKQLPLQFLVLIKSKQTNFYLFILNLDPILPLSET